MSSRNLNIQIHVSLNCCWSHTNPHDL